MRTTVPHNLPLAAIALCLLMGAPAVRGETTRVSIDLPDALPAEFGSSPQRTVRLELFLDGRNVEAVLLLPAARNPALAGWDARDVAPTLAFKSGRLEGAVEAAFVAAGRSDPVPWKCLVSAAWKDGSLEGRAECTAGNASMSGRAFSARPVKLAAMNGDSGFVELHLPGAGPAPGARTGIEFRHGKAVAAASFSPLVHPVWRRVDASGLSLKRGRLAGRLSWPVVAADDDVPAVEAHELALDLDLRKGLAHVDAKRRTGVALLSDAPAFPGRAEVELAFDAPLVGGERWRRRAVARLDLSPGKVAATAFLNGRADPGWNGVADATALSRKGGRIEGALEAIVASATVQPGVYTVRFSGEMVGPWIVGTFECDLAGGPAAKGDFTGWFAAAGK